MPTNPTPRILVAYATRTHTTQEVAEFMAGVLREQGAEVDVLPAAKIKDVSPYTAVVLGSGIRIGRPFPEALKLVEKQRAALNGRPVAYFLVCLTLWEDTPENRATVDGYFAPLRALKEPVSTGMFAGAMYFDRLGIIMRAIFKQAVKNPKPGETPMQEGDFRDWDAIRAWTVDLAARLMPEQRAA